MQKLPFILILVCGLLLTSTASAHPPTHRGWALPADQWNPETQKWLSRAVTAEVGWNKRWKDQSEQVLLAFILVRRYYKRLRTNMDETFIDTIRAYCNGMKKDRRYYSKRMKWLLELPTLNTHMKRRIEIVDYPIRKPKHWSRRASWKKHQRYYGRTWVAMGKWAHGGFKHPCPGAVLWGSPEDPKPKNLVRICPRFRNYIYGAM